MDALQELCSASAQLRNSIQLTSLEWQRVESSNDTPPPSHTFQENVGSTLQMPAGSHPVDFFLKLMDENICEQIVEETNRCKYNITVKTTLSSINLGGRGKGLSTYKMYTYISTYHMTHHEK